VSTVRREVLDRMLIFGGRLPDPLLVDLLVVPGRLRRRCATLASSGSGSRPGAGGQGRRLVIGVAPGGGQDDQKDHTSVPTLN
jgi:hypothetical protein